MADKPIRIQLSRRKGWRMPANTVKVDRSTPWGNPFITGTHGTQAECVGLFRILLSGFLCLASKNTDEQTQALRYISQHHKTLRGKNLACWCRPGTPCHADVLLEIANG